MNAVPSLGLLTALLPPGRRSCPARQGNALRGVPVGKEQGGEQRQGSKAWEKCKRGWVGMLARLLKARTKGNKGGEE